MRRAITEPLLSCQQSHIPATLLAARAARPCALNPACGKAVMPFDPLASNTDGQQQAVGLWRHATNRLRSPSSAGSDPKALPRGRSAEPCVLERATILP